MFSTVHPAYSAACLNGIALRNYLPKIGYKQKGVPYFIRYLAISRASRCCRDFFQFLIPVYPDQEVQNEKI